MFTNAISYINQHPIIFIIIIVILVVLIILLYRSCTICNEGFGPLTSPTPLINNTGITNPAFSITEEHITQPNYPNQLNETNIDFIKNKSIVRFRTTINGQNYYLMIVPISKCESLTQTDTAYGCINNTVVLVDEKTVLQNISEYLENLVDKEKICNYQHILQCKRSFAKSGNVISSASPLLTDNKLNMPTQTLMMPHVDSESGTDYKEFDKLCSNNNPSCVLKQQYPIDFRVEKQITKSGKKKYTIRGVNGKLNMDVGTSQYYLNLNTRQKIENNTVVGTLCADTTTANNDQSNMLIDLIISEIKQNDGLVMSETETPRYKAKMRISIEVKPLIFDQYGKAVRRNFFLGVCKNNICTMSDTKYARACLFTDLLDQNVLEFEPIVVNYV